MHGSVLFLTLATAALGATVRLNSEGTMAPASAASKDRMNSATLAARDDLVNLQVGRKPIVVNLSGNKPLISSDGAPILGNDNLPILGNDKPSILDNVNLPLVGKLTVPIVGGNRVSPLGGSTPLLKKRKGSFLGLRRRDDANLFDGVINEVFDLKSDPNLLNGDTSVVPHQIVDNGRLMDLATGNGRLTDLTTDTDQLLDLENENGPLLAIGGDNSPLVGLNLNLKRRADLAAIAQVDLDPSHPKVTVDLKNLLGATNTGAPCAEGLAAETVNSDTVQDATADVVQTIVNDVVNNNVDATSIAASVDINGQIIVANNGDAVAAEAVNTQQPAATENGNGAAAQQPAVTENGAGAAAQQPAATDNANAAPAEVNTNQPIAVENPIDAAVNTNGPLSTDTTNNLVDVTAEANGQNIVHATVNPGNENPIAVEVNTDRVPVADIRNADLLAENVDLIGTPAASNSFIELVLFGEDGRPLELNVNPNSDSLVNAKVGENSVVHLKRRLYQKRQHKVLGDASSTGNDLNVLTLDLSGIDEAKGIKVLGTNVLGRRNHDDDDEEEEDEDDDEEEEVKGSTVKDDKTKDAKDNHPAADTNNDKKEAPKNEPEKHKNSASSGSTSNKIALLGALVGTVFMLA